MYPRRHKLLAMLPRGRFDVVKDTCLLYYVDRVVKSALSQGVFIVVKDIIFKKNSSRYFIDRYHMTLSATILLYNEYSFICQNKTYTGCFTFCTFNTWSAKSTVYVSWLT